MGASADNVGVECADTVVRGRERPLTAIVASDDVGRRKLESTLAEFRVIASSSSVASLLCKSNSDHLDVIVLWGGQISSSWQQDVHRLAAAVGTAKIIVAAADDRGRGVRRALRAGATGFVPMSDVARCLSATINAAMVGQICVPPGGRGQLAYPALSHREKKILELITLGHTNSEIASALYLAESTVKRHVSACYRQLGVTSRAEAAMVALDPQSATEIGLTVSARLP
jgi:DNA-binding NarL/FixJ family response regulator